jgi:hypothetical protein
MKSDEYGFAVKIMVLIAYLLMIGINAMANLLPLNGLNTGQVSDLYPNLFTPSPFTFTVWSLIYFLLACYVLYQIGLLQRRGEKPDAALLKRIAFYFIISSLANATWIVSWHYQKIFLSLLLMIIILFSLIFIVVRNSRAHMTTKEKFFLKLPFSIYFGWITIATIANVIVLLVSIGWNGWGLTEEAWLLIVLVIGMLIGVTVMLARKDFAYGLVLIWAYFGILIRHITADGFDGAYPKVIVMLIVCIAVFAIAEVFLLLSAKKRSCRYIQ